jgi:primosomal protein N' (replication factor Y)
VLPDVAAIDKVFDYLVPPPMDADVRVGTMVRIELQGRRVGGWVVEDNRAPPAGVALKPLAKVTGWGPPPELIELARWAAWRWAGRTAALLGAASPQGAVRGLPAVLAEISTEARADHGGSTLLRLPPAHDLSRVVLDVVGEHGPAIVLAPTHAQATEVAAALRREGVAVALLPRQWALARAGGPTVVVGARGAAWAPTTDARAIVVLDGHDEAYQEERAPTWNATDVAIERARRADIPCIVTSPCPTLELLAWQQPTSLSRQREREGWPIADVLDRRKDDPRTGLYSERLVDLLRRADRPVCVLNRKGRTRLYACAACGELARCATCGASVREVDDQLVCQHCGATRPRICIACGSTRLKSLRVGVTRAREELEAILRRPVAEVTGDTDGNVPATGAVIGTEAALHRITGADAIAFLDLDQELLAPRYRAAEQAMALLARAARILGDRRSGHRLILQTRLPDHDVVDAVLHGDPARVTDAEAPKRAALLLPPTTALAALSGAAAGDLAARLLERADVAVLGPSDDRWLVRAPDHAVLADALAAAGRPEARRGGRLRIEVDPRRI